MKKDVYRIGEVASMLDLETYVIRFWETEFPHLAPLRTPKGQRLYTQKHIAALLTVKALLHEHGMTIEGARRLLAENKHGTLMGAGGADTASAPPAAEAALRQALCEVRAELAELRDSLRALNGPAAPSGGLPRPSPPSQPFQPASPSPLSQSSQPSQDSQEKKA